MGRPFLASTAAAIGVFVSFSPTYIAGQAPGQAVISVRAALVATDLQVKPVPLHQLLLVRVGDTSTTISFRTGLDGTARQTATPGSYWLRSVEPVQLMGKTYRWNVAITLTRGQVFNIELTNVNAAVDSLRVATQPTTHEIAPEIAVYNRLKRGIVLVQAGLGHGSGFFIDTLGGLIVTNDHVISGERSVSVMIDSIHRMLAQVVVHNHDVDLALLRINGLACRDCPRLRLARPDSGGQIIVPGERVIAVGFPLSQTSTVTSGIVSSVRQRAIISDVNINSGNSGGPLLSLTGEVVGVNTFAERGQVGPGVSGSILITELSPLLKKASDTLATLPSPPFRLLPTLSGPPYPLAELRSAAESVPPDAYDDLEEFKAGNFVLSLSTPVANFVFFKKYDDEMSKDRRKREARAGLSGEERYSDFGDYRDWIDYVGDLTSPAVKIAVIPKQGETFGSALGRALSASAGSVPGRAKYVFKGDVQDVEWYRNGSLIDPVVGGRTPQRVYVQNAWIEMKDVAYEAFYVFGPSVFSPDSTGAPPSIIAHISDLKHLDDRDWVELSGEVVARVWNDFGPYYLRSGRTFRPADAQRFRSGLDALCARLNCQKDESPP